MKTDNLVTHPTVVEHAPDFKEAAAAAMNRFKDKSEQLIDYLFGKLLATDANQVQLSPQEKLLEAVKKARNDWMIAKSNFALVSDDDLVDQAIYAIAAAEKKYLYLLKMARKENVTADMEDVDLNRMIYKGKDFNN